MRRTILMSMLLAVAAAGYCQDEVKSSNFFSKLEYGISLGFEYSNLKPTLADWNAVGIADDINDLQINNTGGFSMGTLYQYSISEQFKIRLFPTLVFEGGTLNYDLSNGQSVEESIRAVTVGLPLHAVFTKINPNNGISPSFFFGGQYILNIDDREDNVLDVRQNNFALDLGIGFQKSFKDYFDYRLEFTYSLGMNEVLNTQNNLYHNALDGLIKDMISIRMLFLGNS